MRNSHFAGQDIIWEGKSLWQSDRWRPWQDHSEPTINLSVLPSFRSSGEVFCSICLVTRNQEAICPLNSAALIFIATNFFTFRTRNNISWTTVLPNHISLATKFFCSAPSGGSVTMWKGNGADTTQHYVITRIGVLWRLFITKLFIQWVYCTTWPAVARAGEAHVPSLHFPSHFPVTPTSQICLHSCGSLTCVLGQFTHVWIK